MESLFLIESKTETGFGFVGEEPPSAKSFRASRGSDHTRRATRTAVYVEFGPVWTYNTHKGCRMNFRRELQASRDGERPARGSWKQRSVGEATHLHLRRLSWGPTAPRFFNQKGRLMPSFLNFSLHSTHARKAGARSLREKYFFEAHVLEKINSDSREVDENFNLP